VKSAEKEPDELIRICWVCAACRRNSNLAHWLTCSACGEGKPQPKPKDKKK
jgi:hypothetical protein